MDKLGDPAADVAARLAALHKLLQMAFQELQFANYRPRFLSVLLAVVADVKADPALRAQAVEKLVVENHPAAAQYLTAGINNPGQAFVPLAKAVQLLALDDHGVAAAAAREAIKISADANVWTEAMHALAGDPTAAPLLESVLADKNRPLGVRLASAAGLHALDPGRLLSLATGIVGDQDENDELRADMLSALGAAHATLGRPLDPVIAGIAQNLSDNSPFAPLRDAARRLLALSPAP
jgi:hypothetical protein